MLYRDKYGGENCMIGTFFGDFQLSADKKRKINCFRLDNKFIIKYGQLHSRTRKINT